MAKRKNTLCIRKLLPRSATHKVRRFCHHQNYRYSLKVSLLTHLITTSTDKELQHFRITWKYWILRMICHCGHLWTCNWFHNAPIMARPSLMLHKHSVNTHKKNQQPNSGSVIHRGIHSLKANTNHHKSGWFNCSTPPWESCRWVFIDVRWYGDYL